MALEFASDIHEPKGTGAVELDTTPVVAERTADNTSTGAVKMPAVEEIRIAHLSQDVVVQSPTPGPVTVFHSAFPRLTVEDSFEKEPAKEKKVKAKVIKETKVVKAPPAPTPKTGKEAEVK